MAGTQRGRWLNAGAQRRAAAGWWDLGLVALFVPLAIVEGTFREGVPWRPVTVVHGLVVISTLLWRRSHPFLAVAVAFGSIHLFEVLSQVLGIAWTGLFTSVCVLMLPYALLRRGSIQEVALGALIMFGGMFAQVAAGGRLRAAFGGSMILLVPTALGGLARLRAARRNRELERAKARERAQIARELHDTVAHHVSAIVVQAQAGRVVAADRPEAATAALEVIEEAASRTLAEMRRLVRALRDDERPELAPQPAVADLVQLCGGRELPVDLRLSGEFETLEPSLQTTIYRLVQESITNAIRHAEGASRITVELADAPDALRLTIHDDGSPVSLDPNRASGYGLVGMSERVKLHGGTFEAGPGPDGGWTVSSVFPRRGGGR